MTTSLLIFWECELGVSSLKEAFQQFLREIRIREGKDVDAEVFPFSLPVVKTLGVLKLHPKVTFFVGENGSGKSTLLEAIAVSLGFNAEGGTKNFSFTTAPENQNLASALLIVKGTKMPKDGFFYRADSFYNVASEIDRLGLTGYSLSRSLHQCKNIKHLARFDMGDSE
jgi:predicted ATPase